MEKSERRKRQKHQCFVLFVASIKYFVLSMLQICETDYMEKADYRMTQLTVCFSVLLFGSIYDNTRQHKKILVCVEVIIVSLVVIIMIMQLFLIDVISF